MDIVEAARVLGRIRLLEGTIRAKEAKGEPADSERDTVRDLTSQIAAHVLKLVDETTKEIGTLECDKVVLEQIAFAAEKVTRGRMLYCDGASVELMIAVREWQGVTGRIPRLGRVVVSTEVES